ncbi:MAG TPA: hypothetical protein VGM01_11545 [Ktedonobacteraceae bacterium]|jgi:hypothetical protein
MLPEQGLGQHLDRFGESLFRVTLLVKDLEQARNYLNAHGVNYTTSGTARHMLLWINSEQSNSAALVLRQA